MWNTKKKKRKEKKGASEGIEFFTNNFMYACNMTLVYNKAKISIT